MSIEAVQCLVGAAVITFLVILWDIDKELTIIRKCLQVLAHSRIDEDERRQKAEDEKYGVKK